jgi:hypothetical protein
MAISRHMTPRTRNSNMVQAPYTIHPNSRALSLASF